MKYLFINKQDDSQISIRFGLDEAVSEIKQLDSLINMSDVEVLSFNSEADVKTERPEQIFTGEQFLKRAESYDGLSGKIKNIVNKVDLEDKKPDAKEVTPVSQDRAGILKNLSAEEQLFVLSKIPDKMLTDEISKRISTYNQTLDKIMGNIKGLEVRI